ncbi:hypothetical protein GCM10027614_71590 [Micromonospora vulcania]
MSEHVPVVVRILQGPVRWQRAAGGKGRAEHSVVVLVHRGPQFDAITDPDHQGSAGQGAEVDTDDVAVAGSVHMSHVHLHR